jgi:hypothetical protein
MITLTEQHMAQLAGMIGEIPHKYAVPLIQYINGIVLEQARQAEEQKAAVSQPE